MKFHEGEQVTLYHGNCIEVMKNLPENSVDSIVTDPPYELGFMGKSWDSSGVAFNVEVWKEALRVLKPGGHLIAFSGSRTYHRMAVAIEDAGFEIRDQIMWIYGSGFPKSHDVSKGIDKQAGAEREVVGFQKRGNSVNTDFMSGGNDITAPATAEAKQWQGWGTALKPAHEPMVLARKPLIGTVAANVLEYGTGGLNIDATRVGETVETWPKSRSFASGISSGFTEGLEKGETQSTGDAPAGRWPANLIHDGLEAEWAKFFYCAKASKRDRNEGLDGFEAKRASSYGYDIGLGNAGEGMFKDRNPIKQNHHPTVKPTDLMRYLIRLVTPPGGTVLDPFMGSGSTGKAAIYENKNFIGIEMTDEYLPIAKARIEFAIREEEGKL